MAAPTLSERIYRLLLRCYPGEFRDEYENEMLLAFRERLASDRRIGAGAIVRLWWQLLVESVLRAPGEHLDVLRQDVRYALRSLRRAPIFTFTAVATLALGVGANTAMFSVVHAVALTPLPFAGADRLVRIWERNDELKLGGFSASLPNYLSWKERSKTVEIAGWRAGNVTLRSTGDPVRVRSASVGVEFFDVLRTRPLVGRLFGPGDGAPSSAPVAVIGEALWRSQFGGRMEAVGETVAISGTSHTIVGVIAKDSVPTSAEFFTPLHVDPARDERDNHVALVIGRLRDGVTLEQAQAELDGIAKQLETEFPASNKGWGIAASSAYDWLVPPETRRALYVLLGAVGCVLLIVSSNVAGLMLARASSRRREMALRLAIGAARRRLVRQVLTEALVVTGAGTLAGVLLAYWIVPALRQWLPASLPRADETVVNASVLWFSVVACFVTGLAFALVPAFAGSRGDVVDALKNGGRGSTAGSHRWRQTLAVAQVALATVLLVGAGLCVQSLTRLQSVELGFDPRNITTATIGLPNDRYRDNDAAWAFYRRLIERLESSPGVSSAALSSGAPFAGGNTGMPINAVGPSLMNDAALQTDWRMVSPGYFRAVRIPVLRGRDFTGSATTDAQTIVVSRTMARRMWGDDDPIGRQIKAGPNGIFTVVGVTGDARNIDLSVDPSPTMYLSLANYVWPTMTIIVRTAGASSQAPSLLRTALKELDPQLALDNVREMEAQVSDSASQRRLNAALTSSFAIVAALLAAIGIYGVLAYLVAQRQQEIGIRIALGAARSSVLRLVLGRGLILAAMGLVAGVVAALATSRWLESIVFGISARDVQTFAAALVIVAAIVFVASYFPARRATRVDPLVALRQQ